MDLFSDLITAVQSDLTINDSSTLYPLTTVKLAINRSKRKSEALFRWPQKEDAKTLNSQANVEYYDMPTGWEPDSMWKLTLDDDDYGTPLDFKDYLYEKENNVPSGKTKMWTTQNTRFFIYPTPSADGDNNISIWGQKVPDALTNPSDTTIFSYSMPECNEAIVLEAVAILKSKGEQEQTGLFRSAEAKTILTNSWNKLRQNQAKNEKTTPQWNVPDFFAPANPAKTRIGEFNN